MLKACPEGLAPLSPNLRLSKCIYIHIYLLNHHPPCTHHNPSIYLKGGVINKWGEGGKGSEGRFASSYIYIYKKIKTFECGGCYAGSGEFADLGFLFQLLLFVVF